VGSESKIYCLHNRQQIHVTLQRAHTSLMDILSTVHFYTCSRWNYSPFRDLSKSDLECQWHMGPRWLEFDDFVRDSNVREKIIEKEFTAQSVCKLCICLNGIIVSYQVHLVLSRGKTLGSKWLKMDIWKPLKWPIFHNQDHQILGVWVWKVQYLSPNLLRPPEPTWYLDPLNLALLGPCLIPHSPKIRGLTYPLGKFYANFWNILEGSPGMSLGLLIYVRFCG